MITIKADSACGSVLAADLRAPHATPAFRSSSMDGFAVRAATLEKCSHANPIRLPIVGQLFPGDDPSPPTPVDGAVRIMTGAPIPDQCDAVVKVEDVTVTESAVTFHTAPQVGQYIREAGDDLAAGERLLCRGHRLGPLDMGPIARIGVAELSVFRRARAYICVTGDELVEPGQPLSAGKSYNANGQTVAALIKSHCESVLLGQTVEDDLTALSDALDSDCDVVITCGGVSAGDRDFVPAAAAAAGWETVFHKVAIKPGKPFFFASRGRQFLFGLPGNPLSAAVSCAVFVLPALKKLAGRKDYQLHTTPARLAAGEARRTARTLIWPGTFRSDVGGLCASYSPKSSSAALSALLNTDGLIIQPPLESSAPAAPDVQTITWEQILR
ncbi:MAG TPA: molybdopterin molybdotransferase MoeA [candidate division Zixibacteria bacterium]|nr:molybdopterin molybdotransferase MoeA [candidate division Zixibacteria bacterium]